MIKLKDLITEAIKDPKLKVGQKIRIKKSGEVFILRQITHGNSGIPEDPARTSYVFVKREAGGNRKEFFTKKTWWQALKKKWIQLESVNESGILYKAGVKKYGKEGMAKILSAAGKKKSHAEIGAIKDKYEKDKKESVSETLDDDEKTGYLHMMKMRKKNKTMFLQMTKSMGSDWGKLVKKAEKKGWTKLVDSVNEAPDDKIQVRGIGMYTYDTLKKDVIKKAEDLYKNAKAGKWSKISRNGLRAYAELWHALSEYERKR